MISGASRSRVTRAAARGLGRRHAPLRRLLLPAVAVFLLAAVVRLAYVADAAPTLYTWQQHGVRMALHYTEAAEGILAGDGLLYPRVWPHPSETRLVSRPPGYPVFVAAVHRTLGSSYADVLAAQSLLTALLPVALLVLVTRVAGSRAGVPGRCPRGPLDAPRLPRFGRDPGRAHRASSPSSPFFSSGARAAPGAGPRPARLAAAGATVGVTTWLRPNFLLLAPAPRPGRSPRARRGGGDLWPKAAGMVAVALAVVAPITIRNARIYGEFVPVSTNGGIVLWEGIADAGGREFGARSLDLEVAAEEAKSYFGDPRYAEAGRPPTGSGATASGSAAAWRSSAPTPPGGPRPWCGAPATCSPRDGKPRPSGRAPPSSPGTRAW